MSVKMGKQGVSTLESEERVRKVWEETLERSPLVQTLGSAARLRLEPG